MDSPSRYKDPRSKLKPQNMKDLFCAFGSWTARNCFTIKPQVSPVCRGDGGFLLACAEKKTVPLFIKAPLWSQSVQFLPVSDHSTTSLLALLPAADRVVKGDEWVLTLSGNRYPIVEDWVIVLSFHFALFPVKLFYSNRGKKSPLVITSYAPTLLTNTEGISPDFSFIWRRQICVLHVVCMATSLWLYVHYTFWVKIPNAIYRLLVESFFSNLFLIEMKTLMI